jgi:hypothetical protein
MKPPTALCPFARNTPTPLCVANDSNFWSVRADQELNLPEESGRTSQVTPAPEHRASAPIGGQP